MRFRLGSFLYLLGSGLVFVFILSMLGKEINLAYLILAGVAFFFGFLFRKKPTYQDSGRFSTIKRFKNKSNQNQEVKQGEEKD
jgi:hypothetical protein